jgi:hypothetical protein
MKPFDIFSWQPSGWPEPHPCVVVSHPSRTANKDPVEVLMCSSKKAAREAEPHEVILDTADGMDWPTICKCDLIYAVPKSDLKRFRGEVSPTRRAVLVRTMIAAHGWTQVLAAAGR